MVNKFTLVVLVFALNIFSISAQVASNFSDSICKMINEGVYSKKVKEQQWSVKLLSERRYTVEIKREGNLVETVEILSGNGNCLIDGLRIVYYPDQSKRIATPYSAGVVQGKETWYYPDGKILKVSSFDKGVLSGYYLEYYKNGYIKANGRYEDGLKQGEWITYYPSYKVKTKGSYFPDYIEVAASNNGDSIAFKDSSENLLSKRQYKKALDSLMVVLQVDDISDLVFPLKLYAKDGEWIYYDEAGNIIKKEYYKKGKLLRTEE